MPIQVIMPQFGESVVEGTITRWIKSVGETVGEHEPLVEVNTDKVDTEVPCPASGILLEILVEEGKTVAAGTVLATVGQAGESVAMETAGESLAHVAPETLPSLVPANPDIPKAPPVTPTPTGPAKEPRELGFVSPVVARMAQEHRIDLYQVPGTGLAGRITKQDVLQFLETRPSSPVPGQPAAGEAPPPGELIPLTPVRRAIAEHMVMSKRTSPHATTVMEADLSRVTLHRQANKEEFSRDGANLTFTPYFVLAAVQALKAYPTVNSSWSEDGIRIHPSIHIGLATSLEDGGLIVPVIRSADGLSLLGLARAVNDLSSRARSRQLSPAEVRGGTFTLTNHGTNGSLFATPIINQPQCGILGIGMIQKRVVVISDEQGGDVLAIRPMVYLSFTFDHRILDGAIADHFLSKVVESLEHFG
jgi:pyruvate/2-oxoglutarate dehydrogenase complex dihydrolipoamide acyltransferase (E2) component